MLERLKQDFKNDLIAGLLVVIPLATTIWLSTTIARWVFTFLTRVPKQINPFNDLDPLLGNLLNLLIGLAVPLLIIMFIGLMARNIAGQWLLDLGERTLQAIPFAGSLYKTLKQLLETLFRDTQDRFRRVVLLEYPRKGVWAIAFVTGAVGSSFQDHLEMPMLSLFIPTTPNPTTGWYVIVAENEVIDTDMSVEDAFKVLISGGIVTPHSPGTNGSRSTGSAKNSSTKPGTLKSSNSHDSDSHNSDSHNSDSHNSNSHDSTPHSHNSPNTTPEPPNTPTPDPSTPSTTPSYAASPVPSTTAPPSDAQALGSAYGGTGLANGSAANGSAANGGAANAGLANAGLGHDNLANMGLANGSAANGTAANGSAAYGSLAHGSGANGAAANMGLANISAVNPGFSPIAAPQPSHPPLPNLYPFYKST